MIYNRIQFSKAQHLGWRFANPAKDFDQYGNPIESNYIVFVRIADCKITKNNEGKLVYDPSEAPMHGIQRHSETGMAYGTPNRRRKNDQEFSYSCPVFLMLNGFVYKATIPISKKSYDDFQQMTKPRKDV